jgi:hypothetical protein
MKKEMTLGFSIRNIVEHRGAYVAVQRHNPPDWWQRNSFLIGNNLGKPSFGGYTSWTSFAKPRTPAFPMTKSD